MDANDALLGASLTPDPTATTEPTTKKSQPTASSAGPLPVAVTEKTLGDIMQDLFTRDTLFGCAFLAFFVFVAVQIWLWRARKKKGDGRNSDENS